MGTRFQLLQTTGYQSILLWLLTNIIGSMLWTTLGALTKYGVVAGLVCSLVAALFSLIAIPITVLLMDTISHLSTYKQRRVAAFFAVLILFITPVLLLTTVVDFDSFALIIALACPYLAAALLAVTIVYRTMLSTRSDRQSGLMLIAQWRIRLFVINLITLEAPSPPFRV